MSSRALSYSLCLALGAAGVPARAAEEDRDAARLERECAELLAVERARHSPESVTERLVSGAAALFIGLYGYYQDDRGFLTKLIYSGTQTAGVNLFSDAILASNQPSLLLLSDRYLTRRGEMDMRRWKRALVFVERKRQRGERKQLAYTSMILAGIYGYNGYREAARGEASGGLRDAFYFLSANFTLISVVSFYRAFAEGGGEPREAKDSASLLELRALPNPTLTSRF